jgi:hypothetical protein
MSIFQNTIKSPDSLFSRNILIVSNPKADGREEPLF